MLPNEYSRPSKHGAAGDSIPFLLDDVYHLFHLASPPDTRHYPKRVRCTWQRLQSKDLRNWMRDEQAILTPEDDVKNYDHDGCWTGSAVIGPDGNMHIFYTSYNLLRGGIQEILHAKSGDRAGTSFVKPNSPIHVASSEHLAKYEATDFRDPYVFFNEQEQTYWMLIATRLTEGPFWTRGCIALLTSTDLESWSVEPEPLYYPNDIFCPECPEIFTLPNGKWYLAYSRFSAPNAGTVYRIADSVRGPYQVPKDGSGGRFDGRRWYAAKSCAKAGDPSKRIYFGWVHDYDKDDRKWLWGGDFAHPREISADAEGLLRMELPKEIAGPAFEDHTGTNFERELLRLRSDAAVSVHHITDQAEVGVNTHTLSFEVAKSSAAAFGVMLNLDQDMQGYQLRFEPVVEQWHTVSLITDIAPLDDFWADLTGVSVPKLVDGPELVKHGKVAMDGPVRIILTGAVLEVFVGGKVITYRLPRANAKRPDHEHSGDAHADGYQKGVVHPLSFFVDSGEVAIHNISVHSAT